MSVRAMQWVFDHSESTGSTRLVLLAISDHCDAFGANAWPSIETIARQARVDRATVFRAIEALEEAGELTIKRRPGRSSIYALTALWGSQFATGEGVAGCDGGVASDAQRGRNLRPKPLGTVPEPSRARATTTQPAMPPDLPKDVKERGAAFFKALKNGERPA